MFNSVFLILMSSTMIFGNRICPQIIHACNLEYDMFATAISEEYSFIYGDDKCRLIDRHEFDFNFTSDDKSRDLIACVNGKGNFTDFGFAFRRKINNCLEDYSGPYKDTEIRSLNTHCLSKIANGNYIIV